MVIQFMSQYDTVENINCDIISYYSKRQPCVALSSTEAEYVALSRAGQSVCWLRRLIQQLGFGSIDPTLILEDNTSAIHISESEGLNQRTKHIDIRHHYIRSLIREGVVEIDYISTNYMLADYFTKPLPVNRFQQLTRLLGLWRGF